MWHSSLSLLILIFTVEMFVRKKRLHPPEFNSDDDSFKRKGLFG